MKIRMTIRHNRGGFPYVAAGGQILWLPMRYKGRGVITFPIPGRLRKTPRGYLGIESKEPGKVFLLRFLDSPISFEGEPPAKVMLVPFSEEVGSEVRHGAFVSVPQYTRVYLRSGSKRITLELDGEIQIERGGEDDVEGEGRNL